MEILGQYRSLVGKALGLHLKALSLLDQPDGKGREPLQLYDLWLNAERRAAQGRYDDAIARVYRLMEWTAQWRLRLHAGIDTSAISEEQIPPDMVFTKNRAGAYQAGLYQSWQLVAKSLRGPAREFIEENESKLLDYLLVRNHSILTHGFVPIGRAQWDWISATDALGNVSLPRWILLQVYVPAVGTEDLMKKGLRQRMPIRPGR